MKSITALEAWKKLKSNESTILVDVRTPSEWKNAGYPDIENLFLLTSHFHPDMEYNDDFINQLHKKVPSKDINLIFICKTNGRSSLVASLAENFGYKNCYVVSDGFMGSNFGPGWLNSNLPIKNL